MPGGITRDVFEIASLFIAVGLISMLVLHSQDAGSLISTTGKAFSGILATATGQTQFGNY
jgi:hypothetical protein